VLFSPQILARAKSASNPFPGAGPTAAAFLARTSGLDSTHIAAYIALLNGFDADSLTAKLDAAYALATQDSTTALLNLVSSSFTAATSGSPAFTIDRGFTGVESSTTVFIETGFNATVGSPNFTKNSGHISAFSVTNVSSGSPIMGIGNSGGNDELTVWPKFSGDNNAYFRVNAATGVNVANSVGSGHYHAARSGASSLQGYKNGSQIVTGSPTAVNIQNKTVLLLGQNNTLGPPSGSQYQCAFASIGNITGSTDVANFNTRVRTFLTALGVP